MIALNYPRPEYLFRPSQIARRLIQSGLSSHSTVVRLPWSLPLRVVPSEDIGGTILRMGVYDLPVTETIWRLLRPGGHALDVGANIGYMTSVMAARTTPGGKVTAFEPHPVIATRLRENVRQWTFGREGCSIDVEQVALSDRPGIASLITGEAFDQNQGTARLSDEARDPRSRALDVVTQTLDAVIESDDEIQVMKIDVEGHEASVLRGATGAINRGQIRNVIFEEHLR